MDDKTKMIFIASPKSYGKFCRKKRIKYLLKQNFIVVVDETFFEFCGHHNESNYDFENLIIIRSFSKWAGLAGLRLDMRLLN
ncbi:MAG: hypothetical protein Ct9H90mP2_01660 [Dehalococcoidia bacterium]|nr:MAG: hypothetical protein Ct9H90mP2_01660 [Dehalococcoidia bacterium]